VRTEPDGARVLWGKRVLGRSPLRDAPVPCGDATLSLRHERYRAVDRGVHAEPGKRALVDERLRRPPATLVLTSSPPKARFTINDNVIGPGPHRLETWRFETARLEAWLPGYQRWTKTLYVKEPLTKLNVQLVPLARQQQPGKKLAR
jgi:hypothetical protein